jgi:hypothetical protein
MLWLVVALTVGGVVLSALQLLATYGWHVSGKVS